MALACGARVAIAGARTRLCSFRKTTFRKTKTRKPSRRVSRQNPEFVSATSRAHSPVGARVTAELKSERRGASSSVRLVIPGAPTSPAARALAEALGGGAFEALGADVGEAARAGRRGDRALRRRRGGVARGRVGPSADLAPGVVRVRERRGRRAEEETETIFEDSPGRGGGLGRGRRRRRRMGVPLAQRGHASDASRYPSLAAARRRERENVKRGAHGGGKHRKAPKSVFGGVPDTSLGTRRARCPRTSRAPWLCCARRTRTRRASWMSCFGRVSWTSAASASVRQSRARRSSPRRTRRARASPPRRRRSWTTTPGMPGSTTRRFRLIRLPTSRLPTRARARIDATRIDPEGARGSIARPRGWRRPPSPKLARGRERARRRPSPRAGRVRGARGTVFGNRDRRNRGRIGTRGSGPTKRRG